MSCVHPLSLSTPAVVTVALLSPLLLRKITTHVLIPSAGASFCRHLYCDEVDHLPSYFSYPDSNIMLILVFIMGTGVLEVQGVQLSHSLSPRADGPGWAGQRE